MEKMEKEEIPLQVQFRLKEPVAAERMSRLEEKKEEDAALSKEDLR